MKLIDKDALVAEIKRLIDCCYKICSGDLDFLQKSYPEHYYSIETYKEILSFLDTLEAKEVDLDALGVLAEHLIACDAHLVTPKYTDKELNLLEEWAKNNKAQKGEEV